MMANKIGFVIKINVPVEIVQYKVSREIETGGPERIRNPGISVHDKN
jgi:hypothetical protein